MRNLIILLLLASSYCQAFDIFANAAGVPSTWNKKLYDNGYIPWRIEGDAPPIVRESILFATESWSAACGNAIKFKEGDGGIVVNWNKNVNLFLGYAIFNSIDTDIITASIDINASEYEWHRYPDDDGAKFGGRANLDSVMLHEFGHVLGLNHPKNLSSVGEWGTNNLPTMYAFIHPGASTLHQDDINGICFLYPSPVFSTTQIVFRISVKPTKKKLTFLKYRAKLELKLDPVEDVCWDFGDGKKGSGKKVIHAYKKAGTYLIRATFGDKVCERSIEILKRKPKKTGFQ